MTDPAPQPPAEPRPVEHPKRPAAAEPGPVEPRPAERPERPTFAEPHPVARPERPTPAGTWPVVVSLALLVIVTPVTIALTAFPRWLAVAVAVVLAVASVWALATSFVLLWRSWGSKGNGVPIIGCILGAILVTVVLAVSVPYAFAA